MIGCVQYIFWYSRTCMRYFVLIVVYFFFFEFKSIICVFIVSSSRGCHTFFNFKVYAGVFWLCRCCAGWYILHNCILLFLFGAQASWLIHTGRGSFTPAGSRVTQIDFYFSDLDKRRNKNEKAMPACKIIYCVGYAGLYYETFCAQQLHQVSVSLGLG